MLIAELPQPLQEEFERTAKLVYEEEGVKRASIEAAELWLAQHQANSIEAEAQANDDVYNQHWPQWQAQHGNKWVVIAHGQLQGVGDTLDEVKALAQAARTRIVTQLGATTPREVELGWQITFA